MKTITTVGEDVEKLGLSHIARENVSDAATLESSLTTPQMN